MPTLPSTIELSPAALSDPRPGGPAGRLRMPGRPDSRWESGSSRLDAHPVRSISWVSDPKLEIQMLHDRVMVRVVQGAGERRSNAGIVIPATAQMAKRLVWGEVYGVGNHVRQVKVGDRVLFHPEDQLEVEVQGQTYLVMRERDLHAVASEPTEDGTGLYL